MIGSPDGSKTLRRYYIDADEMRDEMVKSWRFLSYRNQIMGSTRSSTKKGFTSQIRMGNDGKKKTAMPMSCKYLKATPVTKINMCRNKDFHQSNVF